MFRRCWETAGASLPRVLLLSAACAAGTGRPQLGRQGLSERCQAVPQPASQWRGNQGHLQQAFDVPHGGRAASLDDWSKSANWLPRATANSRSWLNSLCTCSANPRNPGWSKADFALGRRVAVQRRAQLLRLLDERDDSLLVVRPGARRLRGRRTEEPLRQVRQLGISLIAGPHCLADEIGDFVRGLVVTSRLSDHAASRTSADCRIARQQAIFARLPRGVAGLDVRPQPIEQVRDRRGRSIRRRGERRSRLRRITSGCRHQSASS